MGIMHQSNLDSRVTFTTVYIIFQIPPSLSDPDDDDKFALVDDDDSILTGDRDEVYKKLQADMIQQIRVSDS